MKFTLKAKELINEALKANSCDALRIEIEEVAGGPAIQLELVPCEEGTIMHNIDEVSVVAVDEVLELLDAVTFDGENGELVIMQENHGCGCGGGCGGHEESHGCGCGGHEEEHSCGCGATGHDKVAGKCCGGHDLIDANACGNSGSNLVDANTCDGKEHKEEKACGCGGHHHE